MPATLLEMSVSVSYGNHIALQDADLKVFENDFIGVIGPNGGGKTTLLKVILGLVKPVKGRVIFNPGLLGRSKIGYSLRHFQTGDNNFPVTVTDVILSGLMMHKGVASIMSSPDRKKARQVIDELGLDQLSGSSLSELSGGQLQRVYLGRAVIGDEASAS